MVFEEQHQQCNGGVPIAADCFYHRLLAIPLVQEALQQTVDGYNWAKNSAPTPLSHAINGVEHGVNTAAEIARPTYEHYLHDKVVLAGKAACGALDSLEKSYPRIGTITGEELRLAGQQYYDASSLKTAVNGATAARDLGVSAVTGAKQAAITSATLGLGAAVVSTQLTAAATLAAASLSLDMAIASKNAGLGTVRAVHNSEQMLMAAVYSAMQAGRAKVDDVAALTYSAAQGPAEKIAENTNAVLDVVDTLIDRYVVEKEDELEEIDADTGVSTSVSGRVMKIGGKVSTALTEKAHSFVLDPMHRTVRRTVSDLRQSLVLLEYVKNAGQWTSDKAVNGVERLTDSMTAVKSRLEEQAKQYNLKPEALLLRMIRLSSSTLKTATDQLMDRSVQFLPISTVGQLQSAADYVHRLDQAFAQAHDLYDVRDEVVSEARGQLVVVEQSLVGAVDRLTDYPPLSWVCTGQFSHLGRRRPGVRLWRSWRTFTKPVDSPAPSAAKTGGEHSLWLKS